MWTGGGGGWKARWPEIRATIWARDWCLERDGALRLGVARNSGKSASEPNRIAGHLVGVRRVGELVGVGQTPTADVRNLVGRNKLDDDNDRLMPVAWAVPPREVTREKHGAPADFHHTNGSERCLPGPALPLTPACPAAPSSWTPTSDALRGYLSPDTRSLHLSLLPLHGLIRSEFSSLAHLFLSSSSN